MADEDKSYIKSARETIDNLINDDPDAAKKSFHDFLVAKTLAKLNPHSDESEEVEDRDDLDLSTDEDVDTNDMDDTVEDEDNNEEVETE